MPAHSPVCHPREPTDFPLWRILHDQYEDFKSSYDEHCETQYGFFRQVVDEVAEDHLKYGELNEGFAGVRCTNPEWRDELPKAWTLGGTVPMWRYLTVKTQAIFIIGGDQKIGHEA